MRGSRAIIAAAVAVLAAATQVLGQAEGAAQRQVLMRQRAGRGSAEQEMRTQGRLLAILAENAKLAERLELTEKQLVKIKDVVAKQKRRSMELRHELESAELSEQEIISAERIDKKELTKAIERVGELRIQMTKLMMEQFLTVHKILTPEQIEKSQRMGSRVKQQVRERVKGRSREVRRRPPSPVPPVEE